MDERLKVWSEPPAAGLQLTMRAVKGWTFSSDCSCCVCRAAYLTVLAKPLVADDHILPQLQLFIGEKSRAEAAEVTQQASELLL